MRIILLILAVSASFFTGYADAQHTNIRISNSNSPNEPSIILNPKNPKYIVAGANLNSYYYSSDTGKTWASGSLTSTYGVWGDPAMLVDTGGNFYFLHLSNPASGNWIDRIVCQKSTNNGQTYNNGSYMGLNGTKAQDKQWGIVDFKRNNMYVTWTQFDKYGSSLSTDSSHILFSRSVDGGNTWLAAKRLDIKGGDCIDSDNTVEGATPALGPLGQLYVSWAGKEGIYFTKSLNGGNSFSKPKVITPFPGGWDYAIPGIGRCNGLPITCCDLSNGPNKGTIYINWTDQRNGSSNTDVWLIKSTNEGKTWTAPIRVNNDNSNRHQFLSWMTIDQTNGNLYFVFYDRRNYSDNKTDVYLARSTDGGQTYTNTRISETSFTPNPGVFFGDYTNITAHNNVVRPIWTRMDAFKTSVWTALINTNLLTAPQNIVAEAAENTDEKIIRKEADAYTQYPNPFNSITYVSFKIHTTTKVMLQIFDNKGHLIGTPVINKIYEYGKYVEQVDFAGLNVPSGMYYLVLTLGTEKRTLKVDYVR